MSQIAFFIDTSSGISAEDSMVARSFAALATPGFLHYFS
jgi:hypothetical protein